MQDNDETALLIGRTILKFISPLVISIEGHIPETEMKGKIIIGYVGKLTDYAKEEIRKHPKNQNPQKGSAEYWSKVRASQENIDEDLKELLKNDSDV